jgi:hypothetical protein
MKFYVKHLLLLLALVELAVLFVVIRPGTKSDDDPALLAQRIQQQLFDAQLALARDPKAAQNSVGEATAQHAALAQRLPPSAFVAAQVASQALLAARSAAANPDELAMAQARADYQTALDWAGYLATLEAIRSGGVASAETWLKLRSYKPSTRFNVSSSRATLAVQELAAGRMSSELALGQVQRDLDDSYRALLADALESCSTAARQAFVVRATESATLASGYYRILRAGVVAQAGAAQASAADSAFAGLRAAAIAADWPALERARSAIATALGV